MKKYILLGIICCICIFTISCTQSEEDKKAIKATATSNNLNADDTENNSDIIKRVAPEKLEAIGYKNITRIKSEVSGKDKEEKYVNEFIKLCSELTISNKNVEPVKSNEVVIGGIIFDLYDGEEYLFSVTLAGLEDLGVCLISNDTYSFYCDISKENLEILKDISLKINKNIDNIKENEIRQE